MTREEAIGMIKDDMRLHHNYLSGEYRKALGMAISALEQPEIIHCRECEHNNDCHIQYVAQGGELFYCGAVERWEK